MKDLGTEKQMESFSSALVRQPTYFGVAFWGEAFCRAFMEYCLPSLLAGGNIPALPNFKNQNKFLFCTTFEDWQWLASHPNFILLSKYIIPEFISIDLISEEEYIKLNSPLAYKLYIVTQAHVALISRMYEVKCIGSLVFPDTIYAKDALKSVYPHVLRPDKKAVLVHFPRFATPELLKDLNACGYIKAGIPIEIENRELVKYAIKNINIELLAQNWKSFYAFDFITDLWWPLAKNKGMLCHSFMWSPVFINYVKLMSHNVECLKDNTIDGSYLHNNFTKDDLYVITDSDEFVMISYSPHNKLCFKDKPRFKGLFNSVTKTAYWREMIKLCSGFIDPLKLGLLKYSVFVHSSSLAANECELQEKSQRVVQKILSKPNKYELTVIKLKNFPLLIKLKFYYVRSVVKSKIYSVNYRIFNKFFAKVSSSTDESPRRNDHF